MKLFPTCAFLVLAIAFSVSAKEPSKETGAGTEVEIVGNHSSHYEILTNPHGLTPAREGAKELQRLISAASGVELPLVEKPTAERNQIVVGSHPAAEGVGIKSEDLPPDGFRIRMVDHNLYLVGQDSPGDFYSLSGTPLSAGSYFAVIEFARKFLGAEWYMPGPLGEEVPQCERIAVPSNVDLSSQPAVPIRLFDVTSWKPRDYMQSFTGKYFREDHYDQEGMEQATHWGRHLRLGATLNIDVQHAWWMWVPVEPNEFTPIGYGKDHPEYFALRNGQRTNHYFPTNSIHGAQLCVSNPEVMRVCAQNIINYSKRTGVKSFSLSSNDGGGHCECEHCRAWDGKDSKGEPLLTDRLVRFANGVAALVTKEIPDATFGLYAYESTEVPSIKPHPSIRFSDVYNMYPYFYYHPERRKILERDLRGWRKEAQTVLFTSYYTDDTANWSFPWSTLEAQTWLIHLLSEYPSHCGLRLNYTMVGDLPPCGLLGPDLWVTSQLMWDPKLSTTDLTHKFYLGAFGPKAGPLLRDYFAAIEESMSQLIRGASSEDCGSSSTTKTFLVPAYSKVRARCHTLIDQATAAVAHEEERYRWRVDRVARGWQYVELTLDGIEAGNKARAAMGEDRRPAWEEAIRLGKARQTLLNAPESRFALAPYTVDYCDQVLPLEIITEMPKGEKLVLNIPFADDPIVMNGRLEGAAWEQASISSSFKENMKNDTPAVGSRVRLLHQKDGLYIGFECDEPQMNQLKPVDNPREIWNGDVVEVFLVPGGDLKSYVHFSVNPNGIGKERIVRGDRGADEHWKTEWKFASHKEVDSWTAELFIPWKSLGQEKAPAPGAQWYADFFRERYADEKPEYSGWSPTEGGFAKPSSFGRIQFLP